MVDDDFNTCDSVTYMLQQIGLRAEWTLSGKEAVLRTRQAVSRGDNYRVYIIDWLMPDMNGIEVVRRIRGIIGEETPIIILTAYDWSDIEEEARNAGVTAFCSKPIFLSELREVLESPFTNRDAEDADPEETISFEGKKILLAEDNELNSEILLEILTERGFRAVHAENGQEAVQKFKESAPGEFDIILMDMQMPVMDGCSASKEIRKLNRPDAKKHSDLRLHRQYIQGRPGQGNGKRNE